MEKETINISTGIVFRTVLILIGLWFLFLIKDIIALVFISIIIVAAVDPIIVWMQGKKISRSVGVPLVYLLMVIVIVSSFSFLIPPIVNQFEDLSQKFPSYASAVEGINAFLQTQHISLDIQNVLADWSGKISGLSGNIFSATIGIFSGFLSALLVLTMAFYMSLKEDGIRHFIVSITPERHKEYATSLVLRIKEKIGKWMLGQLLLMLVIFILDFVGLLLLGVPYALSLAIFAGLLEIVPYAGPVISAIPAIIVGLFVSPLTGLLVLILFIAIQQAESNLITPHVMKKAVGLHPIAVILALLIGFKLGGVLGAVLSIPIATAVSVFVNDLVEKPKLS